MSTSAAPVQELFQYIDLNEVDPTFKPIDDDVYTLQILKAELKEFTYKKDTKFSRAGDTGQYVKFQLAVVDHPKYAGRRLFPSLFDGPKAHRALRRVMDATGVPQDPGTPLEAWFAKLTEMKPAFRVPVKVVNEQRNGVDVVDPITGKPSQTNDLVWTEVMPA